MAADPPADNGPSERSGAGLADLDLRVRIHGNRVHPTRLPDPHPGVTRPPDRRYVELDRAAADHPGAARLAAVEAHRRTAGARVRLRDACDRELDGHRADERV